MRRVMGAPVLGTILMALSFVYAASAQQRTFVSGLGSDGNPCTRSAPCRTLAQALSQTSVQGEILVLDSAGYGPLSIGKSVSVIAPLGVYAGISVFSGDGIDIIAGPSDTVILRGLTINSQGAGASGIFYNTGGTLQIENCVVNGFAAGVAFEGTGKLQVHDSIFSNNTHGIYLAPAPGVADATIDHVKLLGNKTNGLFVGSQASAQVTNSIASRNGAPNNGGSGFVASGLPGIATGATLNVSNCVATGNNIGILATGQFAVVTLSTSTVTLNSVGMFNAADQNNFFYSRGDNTVTDNNQDKVGTVKPLPFGTM